MTDVLRRTIGLREAIALYVGAVVGAGVLVLPGTAATIAGPASVIAWGFDALLGIPLALAFAALAARFPDAGGVSTYVARAFGPGAGAAVGWFYFFAAATGQIIVPLTGAHYVAPYLGLHHIGTYVLAGGILAVAIIANLQGLRVGGKLALILSAAIALLLAAAAVAALPRIGGHWTPFAPHGWLAVGRAGVFVFFAFFGWEAISHLSEEFINPSRDIPRATLCSVVLITVLYVGVAAAVIGTGAYGDPALDRTSVAQLIAAGFGLGSGQVAAAMALVIALGTANAFVAGTSRLGYALARDGSFPPALARVNGGGVPRAAIAAVGLYAGLGLVVSALTGWDVQTLLAVPNSLGIATYILAMAAGVRLLNGVSRANAMIGGVLCLAILPFSGPSIVLPLLIGAAALVFRRLNRASGTMDELSTSPPLLPTTRISHDENQNSEPRSDRDRRAE